MVFIKREHPGMRDRNAHIEFTMANWKTLAKAAYDHYLKQGRGILLINESDFMNQPKGTIVKYQIGYLPQTTQEFVDGIEEKEAGWVAEYDAGTTLLIGFLRQDGGLSSYRIDGVGDGTPKALYES